MGEKYERKQPIRTRLSFNDQPHSGRPMSASILGDQVIRKTSVLKLGYQKSLCTISADNVDSWTEAQRMKSRKQMLNPIHSYQFVIIREGNWTLLKFPYLFDWGIYHGVLNIIMYMYMYSHCNNEQNPLDVWWPTLCFPNPSKSWHFKRICIIWHSLYMMKHIVRFILCLTDASFAIWEKKVPTKFLDE